MKLDNMNISLTGNEMTIRKTELKAQGSVLKKLDSVYDEHSKLVFCFDVSGSMEARVAKTFTDQYVWTPEILADIRQRAQDAINHCNALQMDLTMSVLPLMADEAKLVELCDPTKGPQLVLNFTPDDEELKERVVKRDMIGFFNLAIDFTKQHQEPPRRIELVKRLAQQELQNRFKKFPKSKIAVIPFGTYARPMFDDGVPDELWPALEELSCNLTIHTCQKCGKRKASQAYHEMCEVCNQSMTPFQFGGGTDIMNSIKVALETCRKKPSQVGVHHFIIVSDGGDGAVEVSIDQWIPVLKASGVTMDYIHIGDEYANDGLKRACAALGGEFCIVNSEKDFEKKFVQAVNRLMLPPAV